MNRSTLVTLGLGLALIGVTGGFLAWSNSHQKLGRPGIRTTAIPGSPRLELYLPAQVADFKSEMVATDTNLLLFMPPDSSFAQRIYTAPDGWQAAAGLVLMGTDRSTIHKPQFCLVGHGYTLDDANSTATTIRMTRPQPYDLPVMKLLTTREAVGQDGQTVTRRGVYIYWFVADGRLTASHDARMWEMGWQLLKTGVLQRWAYITYFAECPPGYELETYRRLEHLIQVSVPEYQLVPAAQAVGRATLQAALH